MKYIHIHSLFVKAEPSTGLFRPAVLLFVFLPAFAKSIGSPPKYVFSREKTYFFPTVYHPVYGCEKYLSKAFFWLLDLLFAL